MPPCGFFVTIRGHCPDLAIWLSLAFPLAVDYFGPNSFDLIPWTFPLTPTDVALVGTLTRTRDREPRATREVAGLQVLLVSFQRVLDGRERFLEVRNRPAHRGFPND
jgi:hypothetical protein